MKGIFFVKGISWGGWMGRGGGRGGERGLREGVYGQTAPHSIYMYISSR